MKSRLAIVVPARNVAATIERVIEEIPSTLRGSVVVVDDGSRDGTGALAEAKGVAVIRHDTSRGYGAAQKSGYAWATSQEAERVILLHGDGQYPTAAVLSLADALDEADCALGSRFLAADGGVAVPGWRRWGNRFLTEFANWRWGEAFSELHTGARAYRLAALEPIDLSALSDDYVFDQQLLVCLVRSGHRFTERPLEARYDDTVQSISFWGSLRYGLGCMWALTDNGATREASQREDRP